MLVWNFFLTFYLPQVGVDGEVVWGEALVSSEHITGEALPVRRKRGEVLPAGALDHDGVLVVRSTCLAQDSTPARIARLTSSAQVGRPAAPRLS
jgi:Cd2+/Zn2+-exporting ATPase